MYAGQAEDALPSPQFDRYRGKVQLILTSPPFPLNRKKKYGNLGVSELRQLRQLRDENARLKRLVADLTLDRHILQEVLKKKT